MRFETFVALRYLRGKRKNRFISLISLISVAGVSVGVMTLIIVLGVMTGFNLALRDTIIGNRAHLSVIDPRGGAMEDYQAVIEEIEAAVPEIQASGPFLQVQALLENRGGRKTGRITTGACVAIEVVAKAAAAGRGDSLLLRQRLRSLHQPAMQVSTSMT